MSTLPYRLQRRAARELRARLGDREIARDRRVLRSFLARNEPAGLIAGIGGWMPWAGSELHTGEASTRVLLGKAEEALRHEFDLLGSGLVGFGDPIDWHRDFRTGHRWNPEIHHSRIRWNDLPGGVDIKNAWDLSRCQHFATLGLAHRLTGDERYLDEFKRQVGDWIEHNPVGRGVNWSCPMDVALRAINWVAALGLFGEALERSGDGRDFSGRILEALWHAGNHVFRNLEWAGPKAPMAGNHFLSNLAGLITLGQLFRGHPRGARWFRFARRQLEVEMARQVHPDGSNVETSTRYHRLVLEMFLWADAVASGAGEPFDGAFRGRLAKMLGLCRDCCPPEGRAVQFGDNDSGRVMSIAAGTLDDFRYLFADDCGPGGCWDRWLLGAGRHQPAATGEGAYPRGGFFFGQVGRAWLGVRAGRFASGGHAHADPLSFVLNLGGRDLIVDRGTGCYTPDIERRNRMRSGASHNIVQANDWEPCAFSDEKLRVFSMSDDARTEVERWECAADRVGFRGKHSGFTRYRQGAVVTRTIELGAASMELVDEVGGLGGDDRLRWHFHAAPGVRIRVDGSSAMLTADDLQVVLNVPEGAELEVREWDHSPEYGVWQKAETLVISRSGEAGRRTRFQFQF